MAGFIKFIFLVCVAACVVVAKHEQYEGYTVYEVTVRTSEEARIVDQLRRHLLIDVWTPPHPGRPGHLFVSKEVKDQFESILTAARVPFKASITNVKEQLEHEDELLAAAKSTSRAGKNGSLPLDQIYRHQEINDYLDRLGRDYPNLVTVVTAGRSFDGRETKYLRISTTNFQDHSKPVVFIQSLLHAREWVTLPASLYAIQKLVTDVTENDLVNDIDWIIVPVANPDGYEWSHTNARFWRKNRRTGLVIADICLGVDLNRNYDIFWGTASSSSVCADDYHGTSGFSEPETQALRWILQQHAGRIQLYVDLHSYGSMILYGYGNGQLPPNALIVNLVAVNMAQSVDRVKWASNPNYIVGNIFNVLYAASGGSSDYAQSVNIPLSFTYELPAYRNSGGFNGFLVDPLFIEQAGYETWEGIKVGARYARDNYRNRQ